jgi:hypothetical protein
MDWPTAMTPDVTAETANVLVDDDQEAVQIVVDEPAIVTAEPSAPWIFDKV